jgi:hypothetical protein
VAGGWTQDDPDTLVLPPGAGPDDPQLRIGDPPALLAQYYATTALSKAILTGALIFQFDANRYWYLAGGTTPITHAPVMVVGEVSGTTLADIRELYYSVRSGANVVQIYGANGGSDSTLSIGSGTAATIGELVIQPFSFMQLYGQLQMFGADGGLGNNHSRSVGRGNVFNFITSGSSPVIGTTETVAFNTGQGAVFNPNRVYKLEFTANFLPSAATNAVIVRVRLNTSTGTQILTVRFYPGIATTIPQSTFLYFGCSTPAGITATNVYITMDSSAGTMQISGTANAPCILAFDDIGSLNDYTPTILL